MEPAALPQPPLTKVINTAADVLSTARSLFSKNPRLEAALERTAQKSNDTVSQKETDSHSKATTTAATLTEAKKTPATPSIQTETKKTPATPQAPNKNISLALKGISTSLLEKIRAREAAAASRVMVRSAADNRQLEVLSRLPEMARILRHTLVAEKRAALQWEVAVARCKESHSGMLAAVEVEEHIEMLLREMPDWITKHKLSSGLFIKVSKTKDINAVTDKLQSLLKLRS